MKAPSVADAEWDRRLLYRLFECWVRLFRKEGWDDLDRIREIVAGLRNDQAIHEKRRLRNGSEALDRAIALRLAALYNWAKATETLAGYMLQGEPGDPFGTLDKHFEAGIRAAAASGDAQHEVVLRWLHATARIMVTSSLWWATRTVNSKASDFVRSLTHREHQAMVAGPAQTRPVKKTGWGGKGIQAGAGAESWEVSGSMTSTSTEFRATSRS